jgi:hypothetical protein
MTNLIALNCYSPRFLIHPQCVCPYSIIINSRWIIVCNTDLCKYYFCKNLCFNLYFIVLSTVSEFKAWAAVQGSPRPSWSWSCGSWICNYLCNQCLSHLTLWVRILFMQGVLDSTLCDKICQWLTCNRSVVFSGYSSSSTIKAEILLKVMLSIHNPHANPYSIIINSRWKIQKQRLCLLEFVYICSTISVRLRHELQSRGLHQLRASLEIYCVKLLHL